MNLQELLRNADPVQHEDTPSLQQREACRRFVLAAVSAVDVPSRRTGSRAIAILAFGLVLVIATLFGMRISTPSVVHAAVRFEVRLAEDQPVPGLREAKLSDSGRVIYLHQEAVVTNADISMARIIQEADANHYGVSVEFNASGIRKMTAATANHLGRPMAILLDGKIAAAPTLRSPISSSAVVSGDFTKDQAEKIVNGIRLR